MGISKVTRNFQVTLPRDVREEKNLNVGDRLLFVVQDDIIGLKKMDADILSKTAGLWAGMKETGADYQRRLRKGWEKRKPR